MRKHSCYLIGENSSFPMIKADLYSYSDFLAVVLIYFLAFWVSYRSMNHDEYYNGKSKEQIIKMSDISTKNCNFVSYSCSNHRQAEPLLGIFAIVNRYEVGTGKNISISIKVDYKYTLCGFSTAMMNIENNVYSFEFLPEGSIDSYPQSLISNANNPICSIEYNVSVCESNELIDNISIYHQSTYGFTHKNLNLIKFVVGIFVIYSFIMFIKSSNHQFNSTSYQMICSLSFFSILSINPIHFVLPVSETIFMIEEMLSKFFFFVFIYVLLFIIDSTKRLSSHFSPLKSIEIFIVTIFIFTLSLIDYKEFEIFENVFPVKYLPDLLLILIITIKVFFLFINYLPQNKMRTVFCIVVSMIVILTLLIDENLYYVLKPYITRDFHHLKYFFSSQFLTIFIILSYIPVMSHKSNINNLQ